MFRINRFYLFFFTCFMLLLSFNVNAKTNLPCPIDTAIVISPIPEQGPEPNGPRSTALIPISAFYDSEMSSVCLSFKPNLGEVVVEILNSTSLNYTSIIVNTQFLFSVIPISFGPGHYIITFTMSSGQQYRGEFNI